jgi:hypothetical protein
VEVEWGGQLAEAGRHPALRGGGLLQDSICESAVVAAENGQHEGPGRGESGSRRVFCLQPLEESSLCSGAGLLTLSRRFRVGGWGLRVTQGAIAALADAVGQVGGRSKGLTGSTCSTGRCSCRVGPQQHCCAVTQHLFGASPPPQCVWWGVVSASTCKDRQSVRKQVRHLLGISLPP